MNAEPSSSEALRLQAIQHYQLLDTDPEPLFDRLTHLARCLFDMPVALISLVDADRVWYKSCAGAKLREALLAVNEPEDRYRSITQSAHDAIISVDGTGTLLAWNGGAEEIFGYAAEEMKGRSVDELLAPPHAADGYSLASLCCAGAERYDGQKLELEGRHKEGRTFPFELTLSAWAVRETPFYTLIIRDITERQQTEAALRESEGRFRSLVQHLSDFILVFDREGQVRYASPSLERVLGFPPARALGTQVVELIHPEDLPDVAAAFERALKRPGISGLIQYRCRNADGDWVHLEAQANNLLDDPDMGGLVVTQRDVSARVQAEHRIRRQATLLDHARDAICVLDTDGRITYWNKSAARLYGWSADDVQQQPASLLFAGEDASPFEEALASVMATGVWTGELRQRDRQGEAVVVESRWTRVPDSEGAPDAVLIVSTDIKERKTLENQFLRAQRMESLGTLAGGIAHDLNNILGPILIAAQMLQARVEDRRMRKLINTMEVGAQRGADLVKQVLAFARGAEGQRETIHLKPLITELSKIAKDTFPRSIQLRVEVPDDLWPIMGDITQLHQVLMNLCVNARDAMPEGGMLWIRADNRVVDEHYVRLHVGAEPGRYVVLSIVDTGAGMPREVIDKIFEPFFTTKSTGTGLGLATVLGIVKGHGGFVNVYSEPGRGTEFNVHLPVRADVQEAQTAPTAEVERPRGQDEQILLVDDEEAFRDVTAEVLEANGYRVLTACDGADALALYMQHADAIDLVLTDIMMPVMDGPMMIQTLRRIDPSLKIIAASGLATNSNLTEVAGRVEAFLQKPYPLDLLLRTLHDVLQAAPKADAAAHA